MRLSGLRWRMERSRFRKLTDSRGVAAQGVVPPGCIGIDRSQTFKRGYLRDIFKQFLNAIKLDFEACLAMKEVYEGFFDTVEVRSSSPLVPTIFFNNIRRHLLLQFRDMYCVDPVGIHAIQFKTSQFLRLPRRYSHSAGFVWSRVGTGRASPQLQRAPQ